MGSSVMFDGHHGWTFQDVLETKELDDGWPESAEEQVTLVLLELVHKRTVVNALILIQLINRKEMR